MRPRVIAPRYRDIAVFALVLALAWAAYVAMWSAAPVIDGDSAQYQEVAQDLRDWRLDAIHLRTPGYPVLLALTDSSVTPTRTLFYASLALHMLGVALLAATLRLAGTGAAWTWALVALLLLPLYVEPAAYVMTENTAQFTLIAGLAALVRSFGSRSVPWAFAAGVAFSLAALIRPIYQGLAPLLALGCLVLPAAAAAGATRVTRLRVAAAILLAWAVIVIGFASFNARRFGWFGISPTIGLHLSTKTVGLMDRLGDDYQPVRDILIRERDTQLVTRGGTHTGTQAIWGARAELKSVTGLSDPELSSYLLRMNVALIRSAPLEYLLEVARSCVWYWFPAAGRVAGMESPVLRLLWATVHTAVAGLFWLELCVLVSLAAMVLTIRRSRPIGRLVAATPLESAAFVAAVAVILYTMALSCIVDIGEPRQRRSTDSIIVFATLLGAAVWHRSAVSDASDPDRAAGNTTRRPS